MSKPIIGIVTKYFPINLVGDPSVEPANWEFMRINAGVNNAVLNNGCLSIAVLPQHQTSKMSAGDEHKENQELTREEKEDIIAILEMCDGVILPGGVHSNPYEEFIAKYCYKHNIPLLGICAGMNVMARALGGETVQIDEADKHDRPDLKYAHKCKITDKNSFMAKCSEGKQVVEVNSIHTYVVSKLPEGLTAVAVDEDGHIEAFEAKDKDFFCAVKFHPELLTDDLMCQNIFEAFTEACNIYHQKKTGELNV